MALTFSKLQTAKDVGRQKSKKPPFRPFLESQHVKASKQCQNLHQRKFSFIFFHYSWENWVEKYLSYSYVKF